MKRTRNQLFTLAAALFVLSLLNPSCKSKSGDEEKATGPESDPVCADCPQALIKVGQKAESDKTFVYAPDFPRIGNLWGFGYSEKVKPFTFWAKHDLLVCQNWDHLSDEERLAAIKKLRGLNPDIILVDTAPLMNLHEEDKEWFKDEWYLRNSKGEIICWWHCKIRVPNLFIPEARKAIIERTYQMHKNMVGEGKLNGFYYDSVVGEISKFLEDVDYNNDGKNDVGPELDKQWMAFQNEIFDGVLERFPGSLIMANDVNGTHMPHVHGRNFEGMRLLTAMYDGEFRWDKEAFSPEECIDSLNTWMEGSLQPAITFPVMDHPIGWQMWRISSPERYHDEENERVSRDFRRMRMGYGATIMTDAYYHNERGTVGHGQPWWYVEYDAQLGKPLADALHVEEEDKNYYSREFENGLVIFNISDEPVEFGLTRKMSKLKDDAAPRYYIELDDDDDSFGAEGPWELTEVERYNYGKTIHTIDEPDMTAGWIFTAPSTDSYTFYRLGVKDENDEFATDATFTLSGLDNAPEATVNLKEGKGGWYELFSAELEAGKQYEVVITSGSDGLSVADAIRLESKARYNDGAETDRVVVDPSDAIVLMKVK